MPRDHLASLVAEMRRHSRDVAVVEHRGNRHLRTTYGELATLTGRFSAALKARDIAPGERVVLWGSSSAEWIAAFFGCLLRGVLVVPLDAAGSIDFAERVVQETRPQLLVGTASLLRQLNTAIARVALEDLRAQLPMDGDSSIDPSITPDTPFQIVFTSGTTSEPKGIVHTHRNVLASLAPIEAEIGKYQRYERMVHPLRFLHTLPLSHVFGQFMGLWIPPLLGAELYFSPDLEPSRIVSSLRREHINVLVAVPRLLDLLRRRLLSEDAFLDQDLRRVADRPVWRRWWALRRVHRRLGWRFWALICGGATLPAELESFWQALGVAVVQGYGMTETAALVTLNHPFKPGRGTLGRVLPDREVRVTADGELQVRGEMLAAGTWQGGAIRSREGEWLATGDMAAQDATGELRFLGRKGDVIVTAAGMNVHPADLEGALLRQDGVRAAAVVACRGPRGEEPFAAVIFAGDDAELGRAVRRANESLAEFQQIRRFRRWPELGFPYTSTGKLLRREIAAWACAEGGTGREHGSPRDLLLRSIEELAGESLGVVGEEARLSEDLHVDSLTRVQLQSVLEGRFGIDVSDDAIARAQTLGGLRRLLEDSVEGVAAGDGAGEEQPSQERAPMQEPGVSNAPSEWPAAEKVPYLRWLWWPVIQWIRALFLELIARPLVLLLAAPAITFESREPLPDGPMLIIANHVTAYDAVLVLCALPARLRRRVAMAMSGEMLLDMRKGRGQTNVLLNALAPIAYWLISILFNVFPLPRLRGVRRSFEHAGAALDHGYSVLIFPEGHRSETGALQPFRQGIGLLAQESMVAVLPVSLNGLGELRARGRWVRSGRLGVHVGTPVDLGREATTTAWTEALRAAVSHGLEHAASGFVTVDASHR